MNAQVILRCLNKYSQCGETTIDIHVIDFQHLEQLCKEGFNCPKCAIRSLIISSYLCDPVDQKPKTKSEVDYEYRFTVISSVAKKYGINPVQNRKWYRDINDAIARAEEIILNEQGNKELLIVEVKQLIRRKKEIETLNV